MYQREFFVLHDFPRDSFAFTFFCFKMLDVKGKRISIESECFVANIKKCKSLFGIMLYVYSLIHAVNFYCAVNLKILKEI